MAEVVKSWDDAPVVTAWDEKPPPRAADPTRDAMNRSPSAGLIDTAASLVSGAVAPAVAGLAGLAGAALPGPPGQGADFTRRTQEALTYQPRTKMGETVTGALSYPFQKLAEGADAAGGKVAEKTGSPAIGAAVNTAIQALPLAIVPGAKRAAPYVQKAVTALRREPDDMVGVGAAETDQARIRRERAADLPVPIQLTKGQAERTFEQQRFERETAKDPKVGGPLRERFAEQNSRILQNFDAWVDSIGAEAPDLRATGTAVADALNLRAARAKQRINAAYDEARSAGDMAQRVTPTELVAYIENSRPESINAPVLTSLEQKLIQLGGAERDAAGKLVPRDISINDLEELRKMVGRTSDTTPTNLMFGREARQVIDAMTDGKGGETYRRARRLRAQFGAEFENHAAIKRLMATKPGTTDRAVAFEDVFRHSVLTGSLDDVRALRRTLQTAGEPGAQAWRELQGQTVNYLKEEATKNVARDIKGNRIVSAAQIDKAVRNLDRDGKLDFIFGKQGAQRIRDVAELAADVYTSPPGAVNTSNTGSVILEALSNAAIGKLPTAIGKGASLVKSELGKRKVRKQVADALSQDDVDRAGVGRIP